jgi:hypothetical protein
MSGRICNADCWLKREDPTPKDHIFDEYNAAALPTSSFPDPTEVAKKLYRPLYPWQTRLIRLESGAFQDALKCKLLTADAVPYEGLGIHEYLRLVEYEALSYCWGKPIFDRPLQCDDQILPITSNLESALRHLRYPDKERYLWIDALCINQHDDKEKADQVQHMFTIFSKAKMVVAWLGPQTHDTFLALLLGEYWVEFQREFRDLDHGHGSACLGRVARAYSGLLDLCSRPWFQRTWIRQEAFGARKLILQCGTLHTHWSSFPNLYQEQSTIGKVERTFTALSISFMTLNIPALRSIDIMKFPMRRDTRNSSGEPPPEAATIWLKQLVDGATYFGLFDPRDRVYAYIGMADEITYLASATPRRLGLNEFNPTSISRPTSIPFPVSYTKSVSEVYQDVIKYLINRDRHLGVLLLCESRKNRNSDIPSWATDYRQQIPRAVLVSSLEDSRPAKQQDLSQTGKLVLMGTRLGILGQHELESGSFESWSRIHFGVELDLDEFIASGSYRHRTVYPTAHDIIHEYSSGVMKPARYRSTIQDAPRLSLVADEAESGDLIVNLEGGTMPFVLREVIQDDGSKQFLFFGPAINSAWPSRIKALADWNQLYPNTEEFVLI